MIKKGLGKGLDALFGEEIETQIESIEKKPENAITELKITEIEPNMSQPRKVFDDEKIKELADSILENGMIQPIVVAKSEKSYKIIAGERRWRAARAAGLKTVPVVIKDDLEDQKILELALIENIQRQDLNAIEEANAYQTLMKDYSMTQDEVAKIVGKSRPSVANVVRLLNLDERVQDMIIAERISEAHARAILSVSSHDKQYELALLIEKQGLSVREIEALMRQKKKKKQVPSSNIFMQSIEENMKNYFGTKVKIVSKSKEKGKIVIEYMSNDDLDRIMEIMGLGKEF